MINSKKFLQLYFSILISLSLLAVAYIYYFSKHYPLPITSRISLDAKIKFIKENINPDNIDTIVVGSSIGLNNMNGASLEKSSTKCNNVLNLSVYESSIINVEQLLELLDAFPNLKRVIYSAQYFDFRNSSKYKTYNPDIIKKYMRNELSFKELAKVFFDASKNIPFLIKRHIIWDDKHQQSNKYTYLGFDHTGSVPLHIYGKDIIKTRWIFSSWFPHHNPKAYKALERIIKTTQKRNLKFYLVHQPYRYSLVKKHAKLQEELSWFDKRVKKIMNKNNATFLNLNTHLSIKDKYFADRSHLNEKGSVLIAKEVGKFIDRIEK